MGGVFNFKFVLEKATGKYFMWAVDDDEWKIFLKDMQRLSLLKNISPTLGCLILWLNFILNNT